MGSRLKSSTQRALDLYLRMEAIKKKMQAMKVEKDNACDRCDACEEASKVAKLRAEKAEEEVLELMSPATGRPSNLPEYHIHQSAFLPSTHVSATAGATAAA